jgi:hypothetical protein
LLPEERSRGVLEVLQLLRSTAGVGVDGFRNHFGRRLRSERRSRGLPERRAERASCRPADDGPERA